jgi:hypothetical protein
LRTGNAAQVIEHLATKHKGLGSIHTAAKQNK